MHHEKQYSALDKMEEKFGLITLGSMTSFTWNNDPKRLNFLLARYKFVSKMIQGSQKVLEIGCGDGFASRIVAQNVEELVCTDIDKEFIKKIRSNNKDSAYRNIDFDYHDNIKCEYRKEEFDAIYMLDVLEHINKEQEDIFLANTCKALKQKGLFICGMPSLESQKYASKESKEGHVNCKTQEETKKLLGNFFDYVFMFSMNDEVVHTGFSKMSHYNLALCANKK